jgi:hypothetical protein
MNWIGCVQLSKSAEGREQLLRNEQIVAPLLQASFVHFLEEAHVISYNLFFDRLIFLRNVCISDNEYVRIILEADIIGQLLLLCRYISLSTSSEEADNLAPTLIEDDVYSFIQTYPSEYLKKVVRGISQLLANITLCSFEAARKIFNTNIAQSHDSRHAGSLSDLTAAAILLKDQGALQAIWMTLINVISKQPNESEGKISLADMYGNEISRSLLKQLMLSLHAQEGINMNESGDKTIIEGNAEGCQLLCTRVLQATELNHLLPFFQSLGLSSLSALSVDRPLFKLSLEQILFLFVFVSVLEEDRSCQEFIRSKIAFPLMSQFLLYLMNILADGLSGQDITNTDLAVNDGNRDIFREFSNSVFMDFCVVSTHILSSFLCVLHSGASNAIDLNVREFKARLSSLLIPTLTKGVLHGQDPVSRRTFDPKKRANYEVEVDKKTLWTREMVRRSLQLLSLLIISSPESQRVCLDTEHLLPSLLQHCATDFENPLAREWALLAVRNLCEESEEARNRIDSLRPQKVVQLSGETAGNLDEMGEENILQEEAFRKTGLSVQLDPRTGKLIVERGNEHSATNN